MNSVTFTVAVGSDEIKNSVIFLCHKRHCVDLNCVFVIGPTVLSVVSYGTTGYFEIAICFYQLVIKVSRNT
jgi:hypothetical protein